MSHSKFTEFKKLVSDRRAVTMLEYGIIAALVAVVAIGGVATLGTSVNGIFSGIGTEIQTGDSGTVSPN